VDLLRSKAHLTTLVAFCEKMARSVDVGRAVDAAPKTIYHNILVSMLGGYGLDEWATRWVKNLAWQSDSGDCC